MARSICSVSTCSKFAAGRGLCMTHYRRLLRTGDVKPNVPIAEPFNKPFCKIDGCERKAHPHQFCAMHLRRFQRYGDPLIADHEKVARDAKTRFLAKITIAGECWLWTASRDYLGYGRFKNERTLTAHRFSYELYYGPIPEGMHVCHKCDVRHCVNPNHLFLGTHQDNMRDMMDKRINSRKTNQLTVDANIA